MDRRNFIQQACFACMAASTGVIASALSGCATIPVLRTAADGNKILVDAQLFTNEVSALLLREKKLDYDILLVKTAAGFRALYMLCTHNQAALSGNQFSIVCPLHGSEFDFDGFPKKSPATERLRMFRVTEQDGKIIVHLS